MKCVKKYLISVILLLIGIFVRVWRIGRMIPGYLETGATILFVAAILIAIDAWIEDFIKEDKDE